MDTEKGHIRYEKVRVLKAFLESGFYPYDFEAVAEYINEEIVGGRTKNAQKLLKELDLSPVGKGTAYESTAFATLKESFGNIVHHKKSRQRFYSEGGFCDIELPFCPNMLYKQPWWEYLYYKCRIRSILAEVKNMRARATPNDAGQIKRYLDTSKKGGFGLLISRSGFTKDALKTLKSYTTDNDHVLILPIEHDDLKNLLKRSTNDPSKVTDFLCEKEIDLLQVS